MNLHLHPALTPGGVAVVTGAADGIGRAAATRFAALGMHVVLADLDAEKLEDAAVSVRAVASVRTTITTRALDVARSEDLVALRDHAFTTFGRVDVLMNNAATSGENGPWTALDAWRRIVEVNLWGVVHGVHAFAEAMIAQNRPAVIVNTGSKQGITNPPGNPAYNVSKAGVKSLTETLQHALRNIPGCAVTAHLLVPGFTFTGLTRRRVNEKPPGAWEPAQVIDYLLDALARGSFYIICPDNEVDADEDRRRVLWAAGDLACNRPPLSRWDPEYHDAFTAFRLPQD